MTTHPVAHSNPVDTSPEPAPARGRVAAAFVSHWLGLANLAWGVLWVLPWLAPLSMKTGLTRLGRAIYVFYGFLCHQFADRSFFLFGEQVTYSASELLPLVPDGNSQLLMRAFRGTPSLGYKVAWSDRMVTIYGGLLLGSLLFTLVRRRVRAPRLIWPALLLLPMAVDGTTHLVSDLIGFNNGFRYANVWLATLTGNRFAEAFYIGNAFGSFNSWARLVSGLLAGLAIVWAAYPLLQASLAGPQALSGQ